MAEDIELTTQPVYPFADGRLIIISEQHEPYLMLASQLIAYHRALKALNLCNEAGTASYTYEQIQQALSNLWAAVNSHAELYGNGAHIPVAGLSHTALTDKGTNTHSQIDSKLNDTSNRVAACEGEIVGFAAETSLHYGSYGNGKHIPVAGLSHTALTDKGTNTHSQIDTHLADTSKHIPVAGLSHTALTDKGTLTHAAIDASLGALTWVDVTFQNAWSNYGGGYQTCQYAQGHNSQVWVRGVVKLGTNNTAIFILPDLVGLRPSSTFIAVGFHGGGAIRLDVQPDGVVKPVGNISAFLSFVFNFIAG